MADDSTKPPLLSRQEAIAIGLPRYFTGKPCKHGHIAQRYVVNFGCVVCAAKADKRYHDSHPGKRKELYDAWDARQTLEYKRARNRKSAAAQRERHPDRVKARIGDWQRRFAEQRKLQIATWWLNNPHKRALYNAMRRAAEARPSWADRTEIEAFYASCPPGLTVDHIVPLQGLTEEGYPVTGLHVPWNLQYLTLSENSGKRNRMRETDNIRATID